jgi:predicted kinase
MKQQTVYILSGVSGSGKSTYIKNHNLCSVSTDELVEEYARENNFNYTQAFDEIQTKKLFGTLNSIFFDNIVDLINSGKDFAIDRTSLNAFTRKSLIELVRNNSTECVIKVVYFDVPKDTVIKRLEDREAKTGKGIPDFVVEKQFESFEKPTDVEGYDLLEVVN